MAVADPCLQEDWDEWSNKTVANKRIPWRERMMRWIKAEVREGKQANVEEESEESVDNEVSEEEKGKEAEEIEDEEKEESIGEEMIEEVEEEETRAFEKEEQGKDRKSSDGYERVDEKEERENEVETEESNESDEDEKEAEEEKEEEELVVEKAPESQEEKNAEEEENEDLQEQNDPYHQGWFNNLTGCNDGKNQESRLEEGEEPTEEPAKELDEEPAEELDDEPVEELDDEPVEEDLDSVEAPVTESMRSEEEDLHPERHDIEKVDGELQEEEEEDAVERSMGDDISIFKDWTSQETDEKQQGGHDESSYDNETVSESFTMEEEFQDEDLQEEESMDDEEGEHSMDEDEDEGHLDEDDLKIYSKDDYPTSIFLTLNEFKDSFLFTDLILTTADGKSFEVHFLVMAAVSSLLWRNLSENKTNRKDENSTVQRSLVSLGPEVDPVGLEAIVEFAYTGLISCLNLDNVNQTKIAAEKLGAPRVLDLCDGFVQSAKMGNHEKKDKMCAAHQMMISLQVIKQLWLDRVGCDVELEAVGGSLHVHRVILAVSSDYFRCMFTLGMKESRQQRVTMPLLSALELEVLVSCSYSGVLQLSWQCIFEVTSIALQLQHQPALSLCYNFLHQEINPHTCLDMVCFAEAYEVPQILEVANDFVLRQFQKVASTSKFKDLPRRWLFKYLKSHSLCVSSELVIFKAIVSWIQAKPKTRVGLTKVLMKTVHFPLMTFKEFKEVRANNMWSNDKLRPLYEKIFEDFCSGETTLGNQCRIYLPKESLVLTGGEQISDDLGRRSISKELWFGNSLRNLTGIRKAMEWRRLGEMPGPARFSHAVAVLKGQLYVFGGKKYYGNGDILNSVSRFDPLQNTWESLAEMLERRSSFSVVVLDGKIFAIGGQSDSDFRDSVERYCPTTNSWSFMWPLDLPLSGHVAKCLHGKIFVCGGQNNDYPCVASMFQYHPETGSTYLASMPQPRAHHCMEILGQSLYVAGGISSEDQANVIDLFSCEVYSPATDSWTAFAPLLVPHVGAGSAVLEGKFYVLGGYSQEDYSDTKMVHRYDPATQRWENMGKMPGPNNDLCASVMCLPQHYRS